MAYYDANDGDEDNLQRLITKVDYHIHLDFLRFAADLKSASGSQSKKLCGNPPRTEPNLNNALLCSHSNAFVEVIVLRVILPPTIPRTYLNRNPNSSFFNPFQHP